MSNAWGRGHTRESYAARNQVMAHNARTQGGRCQLGIPGTCTTRATQAHHTLGKAVTGNDTRYMIAVCGECNRKIGDPTKHKDPASIPLQGWS